MRLIPLSLISILALTMVLGCDSIERRTEWPLKRPLTKVDKANLKKLFERKIVKLDPEKVVNSSINLAVANQTLYAISLPHTVKALDLAGKTIWEKSMGNEKGLNITAGPRYFEGKLFIITSAPKLRCLRAKDGELLWEAAISSNSLALPTINQDLVYVHTLDGGLTALNLKDGRQVWRATTNISGITLFKGSSPVIQDNYVITGFSNGKLMALDKLTGNILWSVDLSRYEGKSDLERISDITATPVIKDGIVYAINYKGNFVAVELSSGNLMWQKPLSSYTGFILEHNKIYGSTVDGKVFGLDKNGSNLWLCDQLEGRVLSKPTKFKNYIIVGDEDGYLHIISTIDRTLKSSIMLGQGGINMSPVGVNEKELLILTNNGTLIRVEVI